MDYLGLGGGSILATIERPTFSVYQLVDGEYEVQRLHEGDRIESPTFAELSLMSERVFRAER